MKRLLLPALAQLFVLALLFALALPAAAGDHPDLTGTWEGVSEAVILGQSVHEGKLTAPKTITTPWFLDVAGQEGRFFWGTTGSAELTEEFVGFIEDDGTTLYLVDEDGHMDGEIRGDTIIVRYTETSGDSMVAAYNTYTRQ